MSSDVVIRVSGVSKKFKIGTKRNSRTLREGLSEAISAPFHNLQQRIRANGSSADSSQPIWMKPQKGVFWALKDVSFEVKRGEVLGIIGHNGSGKSTLLKILSRITRPTIGNFEIWGRFGSLLEVGTGFHPDLTGRENVYLNGSILGMRRVEIAKKFDSIVAFSEIEQFIETPVKYYSSGMYVRLAFAVAAHLDTDILILDEVLSVGDINFKQKSLEKMKSVANDGRTVILVAHEMPIISDICSHVMWLKNGEIHQNGPTEEVVTAYKEFSQMVTNSAAPAVEQSVEERSTRWSR